MNLFHTLRTLFTELNQKEITKKNLKNRIKNPSSLGLNSLDLDKERCASFERDKTFLMNSSILKWLKNACFCLQLCITF